MEAINTQIAPEAVRIMKERILFLDGLAPAFGAAYRRIISDGPEPVLRYKSIAENNIDSFTDLQKKFLDREMEAGISLTGPHRDDISMDTDSGPYRQMASRGQMRAASMVMRLAEAEAIAEKTGVLPVLLIDDVLFELDVRHRDLFLAELETRKDVQIFRCITDRMKDPDLNNGQVIEL